MTVRTSHPARGGERVEVGVEPGTTWHQRQAGVRLVTLGAGGRTVRLYVGEAESLIEGLRAAVDAAGGFGSG